MLDVWAEDAQSEIDRLTRELAEAKARAVPDVETITIWVRECGHTTHRQSKHIAWSVHALLSARPESPPSGLPKEPSDVE